MTSSIEDHDRSVLHDAGAPRAARPRPGRLRRRRARTPRALGGGFASGMRLPHAGSADDLDRPKSARLASSKDFGTKHLDLPPTSALGSSSAVVGGRDSFDLVARKPWRDLTAVRPRRTVREVRMRPMDGGEVVEAAQWVMGSSAGAVLGDWGADVSRLSIRRQPQHATLGRRPLAGDRRAAPSPTNIRTRQVVSAAPSVSLAKVTGVHGDTAVGRSAAVTTLNDRRGHADVSSSSRCSASRRRTSRHRSWSRRSRSSAVTSACPRAGSPGSSRPRCWRSPSPCRSSGASVTCTAIVASSSVGFAASTLLAVATAFAWNGPSLIVLRTFGQLCGAATAPSGMAIIMMTVRREERLRAISWWTLVSRCHRRSDWPSAGLLIDTVGWRALFLVQSVPAAVCVVLSVRVLPETPRRRRLPRSPRRSHARNRLGVAPLRSQSG